MVEFPATSPATIARSRDAASGPCSSASSPSAPPGSGWRHALRLRAAAASSAYGWARQNTERARAQPPPRSSHCRALTKWRPTDLMTWPWPAHPAGSPPAAVVDDRGFALARHDGGRRRLALSAKLGAVSFSCPGGARPAPHPPRLPKAMDANRQSIGRLALTSLGALVAGAILASLVQLTWGRSGARCSRSIPVSGWAASGWDAERAPLRNDVRALRTSGHGARPSSGSLPAAVAAQAAQPAITMACSGWRPPLRHPVSPGLSGGAGSTSGLHGTLISAAMFVLWLLGSQQLRTTFPPPPMAWRWLPRRRRGTEGGAWLGQVLRGLLLAARQQCMVVWLGRQVIRRVVLGGWRRPCAAARLLLTSEAVNGAPVPPASGSSARVAAPIWTARIPLISCSRLHAQAMGAGRRDPENSDRARQPASPTCWSSRHPVQL
jgi:hypothetical protein